ncbi:MAG: hypothetical protein Q4D26_06310 [Clostridia bacterium]|nr:hypothetical protein [Clostridia bacterium]
MKKKLLFIFFIGGLLFFVWSFLGIYGIKMTYYTDIRTSGFGNYPWWEVIRSEEELLDYNKYLKLDLEKLSKVNFNRNAIVLSNGRRINKIVYRKQNVFLPFLIYNYSGIAYLQNDFNENTVFVYLIDINKRLFVDRHFDEHSQYIIE